MTWKEAAGDILTYLIWKDLAGEERRASGCIYESNSSLSNKREQYDYDEQIKYDCATTCKYRYLYII